MTLLEIIYLIISYSSLLSKTAIFRVRIMQAGKDISKPSAAIASFHEMKFAAVARLFEGQSPEFRSHRRINPWNSNRCRVCEVFACSMNYMHKLAFIYYFKTRLLYSTFRLLWKLFLSAWMKPSIAAHVTGKLSKNAVCQAFGTMHNRESGIIWCAATMVTRGA